VRVARIHQTRPPLEFAVSVAAGRQDFVGKFISSVSVGVLKVERDDATRVQNAIEREWVEPESLCCRGTEQAEEGVENL
jgi:hypothetical protein